MSKLEWITEKGGTNSEPKEVPTERPHTERVRLSPADLIRENEILKHKNLHLHRLNDRLIKNIIEFVLTKPLDIVLYDKSKNEMTVKCCLCGAESKRRF